MKTIIDGITVQYNHKYTNFSRELEQHYVALQLDDTGGVGYMHHYYHFIEYVLAIVYLLHKENIKNKNVSLIIFPQFSDDYWVGQYHNHNYKILQALFPNLRRIVNEAELKNSNFNIKYLYTIKRYELDHCIIDKMCAKIYNQIPFKFLNKQLKLLYKKFDISIHKNHTPQLTYIARKNRARVFSAEDENRIVEMLKCISTINFVKVYMEELSFEEQIQIAYDTDIMLGIHGNGLTHSLFMQPHKMLIEIFPTNIFNLDYFMLSSTRKHKYYPMCNDAILNFNKHTDYSVKGHNNNVEFKTTTTLENIIKTNLYVISPSL